MNGVVLLTIKADELSGANHVGEWKRGNWRGVRKLEEIAVRCCGQRCLKAQQSAMRNGR